MVNENVKATNPRGLRTRPGLRGDHSPSEDLDYPQFRLDQPLVWPSRNVPGLLSSCGGAFAVLILGGSVVASCIPHWPGLLDPALGLLASFGVAVVSFFLGVVGFFQAVFVIAGRGVRWSALGMALGMLTACVAWEVLLLVGSASC